MNYKKLVSAVVGIAILAISFSPKAGALSAASMSLSGITNGSGTFAVTVYENTGSDTVTGANLELTFSQAVSNVSYDYSVGPFTAVTPSGAHNSYGTVTGQQPVARVSFKLATPGTVTATVGSGSYLKHVEGTTIEYFTINRGSAAFTYSAPAPVTPAPTTPAPAAATPKAATPSANKVATNSTTNSTTTAADESKAQVEGDSTTAATDDKKKDTKSDDKKDDKKDDTKDASSNSGFWFGFLAILAIAGGFILGRRAVAAKAAAKARAAQKAAAVAAAAKAAEKKTAKASNKKNTKKAANK